MTQRLVRVRVAAGAKRESVEQVRGVFRISVKVKAQEGRANARVRSILARTLGVTESAIRLTAGHQSPAKVFAVIEKGSGVRR